MRLFLTNSPDPLPAVGRLVPAAVLLAAMLLAGCANPSEANIELRKENQQLRDQVGQLEKQHAADQASLAAAARPGVQMLAPDRLDALVTAAMLKINDATGGDRSVAGMGYDDRLKIYVVPTDKYGDAIKAAGSFRVQAFDLAEKDDQSIGDWNFPALDYEKNFYGKYMSYTYVLDCPWQKPPGHGELTVKITFVDALTQRELVVQTVVHVTPPPKTP
jgi:outer membrane murein-binding lipoprotein Lpp